MDIANVGAFLGGASQGVDHGMDLYAKYDEMKQKNQEREQQRLMMAKTQQLAKDGVFKNDPVAGAKQLGEYGAELGRMDWYQQYSKTSDELQKAKSQKSGMKAYVASHTSAADTAKYLNEFSTDAGMANRFAAITNPDGSITMQGMGDDPKVGKRFANLKELQNDTLMFLAPTMLSPEQLMEYDTKREKAQTDIGLGQAQTRGADATTGKTIAETETENVQRAPKTGLILAQTEGAHAGAVQSYASANLANTQGQDIRDTKGARVGQMYSNIRRTDAETSRDVATLPLDMQRTNLGNQGLAVQNVAAKRAEREAEMTAVPRMNEVAANSVAAQANAITAGVAATQAVPRGKVAIRGQELENQGRETQNAAARRAEEEARMTQGPRMAAAAAGSVKAQADAIEATVKAAQAGRRSEAEIREIERRGDYYAQGKGTARMEDVKSAIGPYVVKEDVLNSGRLTIDQQEGAMAGMTAAIMDETGAKNWQAAAAANEVLRNLGPKMIREIDTQKGTVTLRDGSIRKVGKTAALTAVRLKRAAEGK